jgi:hypothetical protein
LFTKTNIEKYFNAVKAESWVFMAIGITGIIVILIFLFAVLQSYSSYLLEPLCIFILTAALKTISGKALAWHWL